jgi:Leucine-rich repeat (LRR) protein
MKNILLLCLFALALSITSCAKKESRNNSDPPNDDNPYLVVFTEIPDAVFEQALIDLGYDDELNGFIAIENIENVTELELNDMGLTDVTGISEFTSLKYLSLNNNYLTFIDISENFDLRVINLVGNPLTCIEVNSTQLRDIPNDWQKDEDVGYALDCN